MSKPILVVEDNDDNRKLFAWLLEDWGYEFECVSSAEEGLAALGRGEYGAVLMDVSLPGMDGKEATRRIRADRRLVGLPVLAVTAHAVRGEAESILASGVDGLVTKPIDEGVLMREIRRVLGAE
jgi:CheY-like chemotaxis protein